jgi:DNA-binding CsgD family transcriptional regulator
MRSVDGLVTTPVAAQDLTDSELLEVLGRDAVRPTIAPLTARQRQTIAILAGSDERKPTSQSQIAAALGINRRTVHKRIRGGGESIENSEAISELDEEAAGASE